MKDMTEMHQEPFFHFFISFLQKSAECWSLIIRHTMCLGTVTQQIGYDILNNITLLANSSG